MHTNVTKLCISVLQASVFADGVVPSVDDCQSELYRSRSQRSDFNTAISGLDMPLLLNDHAVNNNGGNNNANVTTMMGGKLFKTGSSLCMRPASKRNFESNSSLDSSQNSSQMSSSDAINISSSSLSMVSSTTSSAASSSSVASPASPDSPSLMAQPQQPPAEAWRPSSPPLCSMPKFSAPVSPPGSCAKLSPIGATGDNNAVNYHDSPLRVAPTTHTDVESQAWDQLSDILMRICIQVENLIIKKPNYYGVFDGRIITREVRVLVKRALACLNLILHRKGLCVSGGATTSTGQRYVTL